MPETTPSSAEIDAGRAFREDHERDMREDPAYREGFLAAVRMIRPDVPHDVFVVEGHWYDRDDPNLGHRDDCRACVTAPGA